MITNSSNNKLTLAAVCLVMIIISSLYAYFQRAANLAEVQKDGITLARLLSTLDWQHDQTSGYANIERLFEHQLSNDRFAYGVLVNETGLPLTNTVTTTQMGQLPTNNNLGYLSGWLNKYEPIVNDEPVVEYYGAIHSTKLSKPVFFRIGYWTPTLSISAVDPQIAATLILPVLLLLPIWFFLQHRAQKPILQINEKLSAIAEGNVPQDVTVRLDDEANELFQGFNTFFREAQLRIAQAEQTSQKLVTEEKFLTYRAERYESILQTVPDGILILDEDFKVTFLNQHVESMFGVSRLDAISTTVNSWCSYEPLLDYITSCKRDGQRATAKVAHMQDPKSPHRTLGLSTHPLYFSRSPTSNSGLLILLRDVSQEVAAKQSRAEFVGSVSHEIKAPLNTIGLYAQMLESNGDDPNFVIEAHNTITQEVDRLTRLIHNLLSMTQIEMGTFELDQQRVYLADVVTECVDSLDHGLDKERIHLEDVESISPVLIDKELMRMAISNLLTNALKYSSADTTVTVSLEETSEVISVRVMDHGQGISIEDQARIFDKFYRSDSEDTQEISGHGLGLSIAQEILQLHHGSISVESTKGEGSTFTIELWKRTGIAKQAI